MINILLRNALNIHRLLCRIFKAKTSKKQFSSSNTKKSILLTATIFNENWIMNKLKPLVMCKKCSKIIIVTSFPIPKTNKVEQIVPPLWLCKILGTTPSRLIIFFWIGIRYHPDFVGGFHLLINGLAAPVLSRLIDAKSIYFNTGGLRDIKGGGYLSGSFLFDRLKKPDFVLEKMLLTAINDIDIVISRGPKFIRYLEENNVKSQCEIISGGIDGSLYTQYPNTTKIYDIIFVGRLEQVKRPDLFIDVINKIKNIIPSISAIFIGDGSLLQYLQEKTNKLELKKNITFCGYQKDVAPWFAKSKIFLLTSDSEGLSQALLEAMFCSLPCIVSDVGEHSEVITHGENGYLVSEQSANAYFQLLIPLFQDTALYDRISKAAFETSRQFDIKNAANHWENILS